MYDFKTFKFSAGAHCNPDEGMCIMEAVSFINGEKFSDKPECVDWRIAHICRNLNDVSTDEEREQLRDYPWLVIGTSYLNPELCQWAVQKPLMDLYDKYALLVDKYHDQLCEWISCNRWGHLTYIGSLDRIEFLKHGKQILDEMLEVCNLPKEKVCELVSETV